MKKKKAEVAAIEAQEILQNGKIHNNCVESSLISDSHDSSSVNGQLGSKDNNDHDDPKNDPSSVETKAEQAAFISQIEKLHLKDDKDQEEVEYRVYENELQMPDIMKLIQKDLSEPYSIYTYRYFIHNWPHLCFMVRTYCLKITEKVLFSIASEASYVYILSVMISMKWERKLLPGY